MYRGFRIGANCEADLCYRQLGFGKAKISRLQPFTVVGELVTLVKCPLKLGDLNRSTQHILQISLPAYENPTFAWVAH